MRVVVAPFARRQRREHLYKASMRVSAELSAELSTREQALAIEISQSKERITLLRTRLGALAQEKVSAMSSGSA